MSTQEYILSTIRLDLGANSRHSGLSLFEAGPDLILNTFDRPRYRRTNQDVFFEIKSEHEGRLDLISQAVYGTPQLWWLIAYANNIIDPFTDVIIGLKLVVPPLAEVRNREEA